MLITKAKTTYEQNCGGCEMYKDISDLNRDWTAFINLSGTQNKLIYVIDLFLLKIVRSFDDRNHWFEAITGANICSKIHIDSCDAQHSFEQSSH